MSNRCYIIQPYIFSLLLFILFMIQYLKTRIFNYLYIRFVRTGVQTFHNIFRFRTKQVQKQEVLGRHFTSILLELWLIQRKILKLTIKETPDPKSIFSDNTKRTNFLFNSRSNMRTFRDRQGFKFILAQYPKRKFLVKLITKVGLEITAGRLSPNAGGFSHMAGQIIKNC